MIFYDEIKKKLNKEFNPENIILIDNSHLHSKHKSFDKKNFILNLLLNQKN